MYKYILILSFVFENNINLSTFKLKNYVHIYEVHCKTFGYTLFFCIHIQNKC